MPFQRHTDLASVPGEPAAKLPVDLTTEAGGLEIASSADPETPLLGPFHALYDQSFVLPDEKETLAGFRACLALNRGQAYDTLVRRFGAFREVIAIARDAASGAVVGGFNLIACSLTAPAPALTVNLNYLFIAPAHRRKGRFKALVGAVEQVVRPFFPAVPRHVPMLTFLEQNDPFRMSPEAYRRDSAANDLDQVARIRIWARRGAMILDYPYVQPPLSDAQEPDRTLVYAVIGAPAPSLDACVLREHLARFFAISVLKGKPLEECEVAQEQLRDLSARCAKGYPSRSFLPPTGLRDTSPRPEHLIASPI